MAPADCPAVLFPRICCHRHPEGETAGDTPTPQLEPVPAHRLAQINNRVPQTNSAGGPPALRAFPPYDLIPSNTFVDREWVSRSRQQTCQEISREPPRQHR